MSMKDVLLKLANENPELRSKLVPLIKEAMEHPTEEAKKKYLEEHPKADPSNHTVKKDDEGDGVSDTKRPVKVDKRLGDLLGQWHSSSNDPIYAVSSSAWGGHEVPVGTIQKALDKVTSWVDFPEDFNIEKKDIKGLQKAQKIMTEMLKSKKTAFVGPMTTGRNWKEVKDNLGHRWIFDDKERDLTFGVYEFVGPGIPLYRLQLIVGPKNPLGFTGMFKYRRPAQFKTPQEAFKLAAWWWGGFTKDSVKGLDLTNNWSKMASDIPKPDLKKISANVTEAIAKIIGKKIPLTVGLDFRGLTVESPELRSLLDLQLFKSLKIGHFNRDTKKGDNVEFRYWLTIVYKWENYSGGTNGTDIATLWIDDDGEIIQIRSDLG